MRSGPESVITIDCHYLVPGHAAAYLLIQDGQAAFVDNNTSRAVPRLLDALAARGLRTEHVAYIIITHLHLDHAGGTSALVNQCPNAWVLAHPRAVRHLVDPARLVAGVRAVYGAERFEALYGAIHPIPPERIRAVQDDEQITFGAPGWGGRRLRFLHTRGHANHHICIYDSASNGVFTGDAFGVAYHPMRNGRRPFLLCSTAPTDFDPAEARASVHRILATGAERLYLAHFGELTAIQEGAESILGSIGEMEALLEEAAVSPLDGRELEHHCLMRLHQIASAHAQICGVDLSDEEWTLLASDLEINAQGIALAAQARRRRLHSPPSQP